VLSVAVRIAPLFETHEFSGQWKIGGEWLREG
jgi:hypothetical protein